MLLCMLLGLFGCRNNESRKNKQFVFDRFKLLLERNGGKIDSIGETGLLYVSHYDNLYEVSLDNIRKNYERDKDETPIATLVEILVKQPEVPKDWQIAKHNVYVMLVSNNTELDNYVYRKLTAGFGKEYAYRTQDKFIWLNYDHLHKWRITEQELDLQAGKNADTLLAEATIAYETVENRKLGLIETEHEIFKGALLFAPGMKQRVKQDFGLPFYAVIPVRDFCYIFSERDVDFFSERIENTVVNEYNHSGYPVTTEILKFTDKGVEAVGTFPVK